MSRVTISDLRAMDCPTITAATASQILRCSPNNLRQTAKLRPELLRFPVLHVGTRLLIPREPFIKYLTGE